MFEFANLSVNDCVRKVGGRQNTGGLATMITRQHFWDSSINVVFSL